MLITILHPNPILHITLASWQLDTTPPAFSGKYPPFALLFDTRPLEAIPLVAIAIAYSYHNILAHISRHCQQLECKLVVRLAQHFGWLSLGGTA
jgi:hypothetical protein